MANDTDQDLWHSLRAENVGASEIAALFGESPYQTEYSLWQIKSGNVAAPNLDGNERVAAGNWLEKAILEWANHKWGTNFVQPKVYMKHPTTPGMGCTPDGIDYDLNIMAQVKNVDAIVFGRKWTAEHDVITEAPMHIIMQLQQEMACAEMNENHLIALVGGNRLCRMICYADPEFQALCSERVMRFWASIAAGIEPSPDFEHDEQMLKAVRKLKPEIEFIDMTGNNLLYDAAIRYVHAQETIKLQEEQKKHASAEVYQIIEGAKKVRCSDIEINMIDVSGTPDKLITQEDVGTIIKGRRGSSYPKIKQQPAA